MCVCVCVVYVRCTIYFEKKILPSTLAVMNTITQSTSLCVHINNSVVYTIQFIVRYKTKIHRLVLYIIDEMCCVYINLFMYERECFHQTIVQAVLLYIPASVGIRGI